MIQHQKHLAVLLFLTCSLTIGCDGGPRLPVDTEKSSLSEGVTTQSGRGGYDWMYSKGRFDIVLNSDLNLFDDLDRKKIKERIPPLVYSEPDRPYRPPEMDDETYRCFSRYTEPYFDTKPFLSIPFTPQSNGLYSFNEAEDRLALIDENLEIWDLPASKLIAKFPCPTKTPVQLSWGRGQDHFIVVDADGVYRVSATSGKVTHHWQPPLSDSPRSLASSGKVTKYAVSTAKGKLYVLDEQLEMTHAYNGRSLSDSRISINSTGTYVLAKVDEEFVRWYLASTSRDQTESLGSVSHDGNLVAIFAGSKYECIVHAFDIHAFDGNRKTAPKHFVLTRKNHATCMGTVDYTEDWLTCCLSRVNSENQLQYFIQDFFLGDGSASVEFPLGTTPVLEMITSRSTDLFAVREAANLRVFRRQRWKIIDGQWSANDITNLVMKGKHEQAELMTKELVGMPRTRSSPGYSFHNLVAETIGKRWSEVELDSTNQEFSSSVRQEKTAILKQFDRWRGTSSELSILASACRHLEVGARRGSNQLTQRRELARKEIEPLLNKEQPACPTLVLAIRIAHLERRPIEDLQPFIKLLLSFYMFDTGTHTRICEQMMATNEEPGAAGRYLASVADLLPRPYSDILYTKVALRCRRSYDEVLFDSRVGGFSVGRTLRGIELLIQEKCLWPHEVESLVKITSSQKRNDLTQKMVVYCIDNFSLKPQLEFFYQEGGVFIRDRIKLLQRFEAAQSHSTN